MNSAVDISLVLPVFNGEHFIAQSIAAIIADVDMLSAACEVIIVDDGSVDRTTDIVRTCADQRIRLLTHSHNRGKFAAIKTGMAQARGTTRIFLDSDLPFSVSAIRYIHSLIQQHGFDVVVGDRTLPESASKFAANRARGTLSRVLATIVRLLVTGEMYDTQCGIKGFRGEVADGLFSVLQEDRFGGDIELLYITLKYNLAIRRIPVFLERENPSTIRFVKDSVSILKRIMSLRSGWRSGRYRSEQLARIASQRYW